VSPFIQLCDLNSDLFSCICFIIDDIQRWTWKDLRIDGGIILKWIFIKNNKRAWIELIWLGITSFQICGGYNSNGTGFLFPNISVFPCQYHGAIAQHVFVYMLLLDEGQTGEAWEPS